ncbi:MAG: hypothetical protein R3F48_10135 [Candidatus Zixiibacteriota bacterium]
MMHRFLGEGLPFVMARFEEDYLFHNYSQLVPTIEVIVGFHE